MERRLALIRRHAEGWSCPLHLRGGCRLVFAALLVRISRGVHTAWIPMLLRSVDASAEIGSPSSRNRSDTR
jgi:hypothetical protein